VSDSTGVVNAGFAQLAPWYGGHLQTIRYRIVNPRFDLGTEREIRVPVSDGDQLVVHLHAPDIAQPGPLVALVHGLGGSAESDYIRATTFGLRRDGFTVARIDLRGAGRSGELSRGTYHAGRTDDLRAVLRRLADEAAEVVPVGFSLGGNLTLKLLGEPLEGVPVVAGVAVSAPLDLALGSEHLNKTMFGAYESYLMAKMRADSTRASASVTDVDRASIAKLRTILDFDNVVTAPQHGWKDAAEYYAVNSSLAFLPQIALPTLVIHSIDDPMIPAEPYRALRWEALPSITRQITAHGGHVGFHAKDSDLPWYLHRIAAFLRAQ
jgi:hypothetical protein